MALPINVDDLLKQRKVESNSINRSICAFTNNFDNIGGGYSVVGLEEEN